MKYLSDIKDRQTAIKVYQSSTMAEDKKAERIANLTAQIADLIAQGARAGDTFTAGWNNKLVTLTSTTERFVMWYAGDEHGRRITRITRKDLAEFIASGLWTYKDYRIH